MSSALPILVVDDDAVHAQSVVDLLFAHDLNAHAITDSQQGLKRILEDPPQLLILDLNMPGIGGLEILGAMGEHNLNTQTIVLTGETSVGAVSPVVRLGAFEYLAKPPDPSDLMNSVLRAMNLSSLEIEANQMAAVADRSNKLHKFLVDATPDLIYMLDSEGNISFINNKLKDIMHIDSSSLIGQHWRELFNSGQQSELAQQFEHRFDERRTEQRATQQYEFDYVNRAGSPYRLEFSATGLYDPVGGQYMGTYGVVRDITAKHHAAEDRLDLQAQVQQASKMEAVGQLAGGIAHDFNNILASIIGFAELVLNSRKSMQTQQIDEYLGEVVTAGHRARDLISQMLTFTRANRGEPQPVDLIETITDVSRMLRAAIPSTIDLLTDYQDAVPYVSADPVQIQQVILNLLINARDSIEGNGVIEMSVRLGEQEHACATCGERLDGPHVVFSVADTGHGIPVDVLARIFEMYYSTRDPGTGTGIGLWLINDLVHDYLGHLTVVSEEGRGTTFHVHLPAVASDLDIIVSERPPLAQLQGRIMVVDDEVSVSNFIGEVLRDHGYDAIIFNDSDLAKAYFDKAPKQVGMLITDQRMPRITGTELAQHCKRERPDLPVILITGYANSTDKNLLNEIGVEGFLAKPFRIDELLNSIAEHAPEISNVRALR